MERRKETRYQIGASVRFIWCAAEGRLFGTGTTLNIGADSAFVSTAARPPVGAAVKVEIVVPFEFGTRSQFRIKGRARVVRVVNYRRMSGFAILADHWGLFPDPLRHLPFVYVSQMTNVQN
jgi:hypothetical protein